MEWPAANAEVGSANRGEGLASGEDRRRGLRIRQKRPVKVFEPVSGRFFAGVTYDVSGTGLSVGLPLSVPVFEGRRVTVHVGREGRQGPLANRRFMIPARVVWLQREPGTCRELRCGLEFVQDNAAEVVAA